ncbi:MAG: SCO1664 family protein [Actinomycetota bacterium]
MTSGSSDGILELLRCGDMEVLGLLPYASNATLLAHVRSGDDEALAVYKPRRGERPLWDFPDGTLCLRELAAWVVDQALGWDLVAPTVLREGPAGFGAVQLWVDENEEADVRDLYRTHPDDLARVAVFDVVVNNADRKAGHLVVDAAGKLWSVDHGLCFASEPKLRTVIWAFEGESINAAYLADLQALSGSAETFGALEGLLSAGELAALRARIDTILRTKRYPSPAAGRRHVPWPPW